MSRYQPPRDRSPPRFPDRDRRMSIGQTASSAHSTFRNSSEANQIPLGRDPPRGPKADVIRQGSQPTTGLRARGGFGGRPDFRDRERDFRDASTPFRRDNDRGDWPRRDRDASNPERNISGSREARSYVGRDRSASPSRLRRDSRDAPLSQSGRGAEPPSWYGTATRGPSNRGRGRGDWDSRGRGRGLGLGLGERDRDRELFRPRSRSRDGRREWERDRDRDRLREGEGDKRDRFERREPDRSLERDEKSRDAVPWRRDRSPGRNSIASNGPPSLPANSGVTGDTSTRASSLERPLGRLYPDNSRRFSTALTTTSLSKENRKDGDKFDYFQARSDRQNQETNSSRASSPPSAPQVPPFGLPLDNLKPPVPTAPADNAPITVAAPPPPPPVDVPSSSTAAPPADPLANSPQPPFQPPTGPKADRVSSAQTGFPRDVRAHVVEPWQKLDVQAQHTRLVANVATNRPATDLRSGDGKPVTDGRETSSAAPGEGPPFKGIPTGPKSGVPLYTKPRPPTMQNVPASTLTTPTIRRALSPVDQRAAPPLSSRMLQPRGPGSHQWLSQDYKPQRPSNTAPSRPFQGESRDRAYNFQNSRNAGFNQPLVTGPKPRFFPAPHSQPPSKRLLPSGRDENAMVSDREAEDMDSGRSGMPGSVDQSSDEEGEDDEALDEDDFATSEEKFLREMKLLTVKRPPPPLENPVIVNLLLRIQMLGMIRDGAIPPELQHKTSDLEVEPEPAAEATGALQPSGLPSPKAEEEKEESPPQIGRLLKEAPVNPIPTPPIEELPYLASDVPVQIQMFEDLQDGNAEEHVLRNLREELEHSMWECHETLYGIRNDFDDRYRYWKTMMMSIDKEKREDSAVTPVPASPPLSVGHVPALTPLIERTRGTKNTTELDYQLILEASKQSAREEQERRDRDATAKPNYDLEAIVPPMLDPKESEMLQFLDTNRLIAPANALDVFAFVPPQDDFTPEEQQIFIGAFCQNPKKWGKISESLPGRDYKQCILHYYLTKDVAKYKENWKKQLPRKGRRKNAPSRLRSNALISDMGYDENELDSTPMAVTDTGRPRRAAAPTFSTAITDLEASNGTTVTSKRPVVPSKDSAVEPGSEKPSVRGRKVGTKPRRTKAQIQQAHQALQVQPDLSLGSSPVKVERALNYSGRGSKVSSRGGFLASKADDLPALEPQMLQEQDTNLSHSHATLNDISNPNSFPAMTTGNQPSSYWSVPEQMKFPYLIAYFGRDFEAIANFMKTKTVTMIKNNYSRQVSDGKNKVLEQQAQEADEKRERGEPMGPPPSPIAPPKRRYDQTPSGPPTNPQRSLAPNGDVVLMDEEASVLSVPKSTIVEDFIPPIGLQRSTSNEMAQKSRLHHHSPAQSTSALFSLRRVEEPLQTLRPQLPNQQRHQPGPRSGFFAEERNEPRHPNQLSQGMAPQSSLHQPLGRQTDKPRIDLAQRPQTLLPQQRPIAAQQGPGIQQQYQTSAISTSASYNQQEPSSQQQLPAQVLHTRQASSIKSGPSLQMITKQEPDTMPFRRHDSPLQTSHYGPSPAHSPVSVRPQTVFSTQGELHRPSSTPGAPSSEPIRPTPAKRSNIMSILNDEPADPTPPPKRLSLEQSRPQSLQSPPASVFSNTPAISKQPHPVHRRDESASLLSSTSLRHPLDLSSLLTRQETRLQQTSNPTQDNVSSYSANQNWINRHDPRQPIGSSEQISRPQSQTLSQYAAQPPSTQPHHVNAPQSSVPLSHHRTFLGQALQHPGHVPSPPPQTQPQGPMQALYRTSSTSSLHSRMPSYTHSGQPATQGSQSGAGASPVIQSQPSNPHSALQSPTPGMHRPHASMSHDSRIPLQTFEARNALHQPHHFQTPQQQQQQPQQPKQQPLEQRIHAQHLELQQQELLHLQQAQQRASMLSIGGYPAPHRTFTPPAGTGIGMFASQGQHPQQQQQQQQQQQSHHRHFSQEGRAEERR